MQACLPSHLSDHVLTQELPAAIAQESRSAAVTLAYLAEFEARRLFVPAAFASMQEYCVQVLHLSEDSAKKRLQATHAARQFPAILAAVADGRLHLSAVVMLATRLTQANVDALIAAASHKSKSQIELVLAEFFPRPDVPISIREVAPLASQPALLDANAQSSAPGHSMHTSPPARVAPLSPGRHEVRFTFSDTQREKLRLVQCLLGRSVPSGALDLVFEQALDALIERHEKPTLTASARSRPRKWDAGGRYVPAAVRREVLVRDNRQCTFVSESGRRCSACRRLDFDHIVPLAKGGETTAANLRLLCPVHNQHEADEAYGAGFMAEKRAESKARGSAKRASREAGAHVADEATTRDSSAPGHSNGHAHIEEVIPYLRALDLTKPEARRGAEFCVGMAAASLEARVMTALQALGRARQQRCTHTPSATGRRPDRTGRSDPPDHRSGANRIASTCRSSTGTGRPE